MFSICNYMHIFLYKCGEPVRDSLFQAFSLSGRSAENSARKTKKSAARGSERTRVGKLNKRSFRYTRIWYTLWLVNFDRFCQHSSITDADEIYDMAMSFQSYGAQETVKLLFVEGNVVTWQQDTFPRFWWKLTDIVPQYRHLQIHLLWW